MPPLDLGWLAEQLPIAGLGFPRIYEPVIPSTNTVALQRANAGAPAGTLVLTDAQPAGRGRQGRLWVTLPGQQILLSVLLFPTYAPHWLVLAAGLAVTEAVAAQGIAPGRVGLKWPNDVLLDDRKVAGILIETTTLPGNRLAAVVGLGMNVNGSLDPWPELASKATTLAAACGQTFAREPLIVAFLHELGGWAQRLAADSLAHQSLLAAWRARLVTLGRPTTVHQGDELLAGIAGGVTDEGALLLDLPDGTRRTILWGDVE
ncbi:MAG: biotin--[acetyl-CoA-carboxylase] ligase [Ktedonobacterales bacterium]|nr:biotin--[acetyl-CoA-carboxylase] ligase [Ktedonobacterales bacterium]